MARQQLGEHRLCGGDAQAALALLVHAHEEATRILGAEHPITRTTLVSVANAQTAMALHGDARATLKAAQRLAATLYPTDNAHRRAPRCRADVRYTRRIGAFAARDRSMAKLQVGIRGTLDGATRVVVARVRYRARTGEQWYEYLLGDGAGGDVGWLTIDNPRRRCWLWVELGLQDLPPFESLAIGATIELGPKPFVIGTRGEKIVKTVEGEVRDAVPGAVVHFAEGAADDGTRVSITRTASGIVTARTADPRPIEAVERFAHPPPRPRRQVLRESTGEAVYGWTLAFMLFAFGLAGEGCSRGGDPECRFYRGDGSSYTAACSHRDSRSVRSESTGRRLMGFGK